MTKDKTAPERTERYTNKRKKEGWIRVNPWARNRKDADSILEYARKLRKGDK